MDFASWPGGGGNLNYPLAYHHGLASMIKDVGAAGRARHTPAQRAQDLLLRSVPHVLKAVVRFAHRYAALAREMAAKEKNPEREQELLDIAAICDHVPEHPARSMREAMQAHFFCHIVGELEQVGCGYSEAYFGQMMEPYYQREKRPACSVRKRRPTF